MHEGTYEVMVSKLSLHTYGKAIQLKYLASGQTAGN